MSRFEPYVSFARRVAAEAGSLIAESFLGTFEVGRKGATNLVTEVDRPGDVDVVATNGIIHEELRPFLKVEG